MWYRNRSRLIHLPRFAEEGLDAVDLDSTDITHDEPGGTSAPSRPQLQAVPGSREPEDKPSSRFDLTGVDPEIAKHFQSPKDLEAFIANSLSSQRRLVEYERALHAKQEPQGDPDAIYGEWEVAAVRAGLKAAKELPPSATDEERQLAYAYASGRVRNKALHNQAIESGVGLMSAQIQSAQKREAAKLAFFENPANKDISKFAEAIEDLVDNYSVDSHKAAKWVRDHKHLFTPQGEDDYDEDTPILEGLPSVRATRSLKELLKASGATGTGRRSSGGRRSEQGSWSDEESKSFWQSKARGE
jgi:hypothetical protein